MDDAVRAENVSGSEECRSIIGEGRRRSIAGNTLIAIVVTTNKKRVDVEVSFLWRCCWGGAGRGFIEKFL
jgi:hypothetical protein